VPDLMPHGEGIGIDIGLTNFIATSNGLLVKRQKFFLDAERKLKLLQKSVSRKKIGSNNWRKAQKKVALLHEYVTNCRKDWHRKLSHQICKDVGMIFVEDLNLIMLSRGMLGKHCLDASWGQFFTILEQTCLKYGVYFQKGNANKTSQTCPNCLTETGKKQLSERTHSCSNCGYTTDRDVAAAQVVLIRGLVAVGHTACDAFLQVNSSESLRRKNPHAFRLGYVNRGTMGVDGPSSIDLLCHYAAAINSL